MMKCIIVGTTYWNIINHLNANLNGIVGKSILLWVVGQPPFVIISSVHCPVPIPIVDGHFNAGKCLL